MTDHSGDQKGPQNHAEGQQGPKAHAEFIQSLHGKHGGSPESEGGTSQQDESQARNASDGRHRLDEDRVQHDDADQGSEYNRRVKQHERAGEPINGPELKGGKAPGHNH